jgi:hypothetical protein
MLHLSFTVVLPMEWLCRCRATRRGQMYDSDSANTVHRTEDKEDRPVGGLRLDGNRYDWLEGVCFRIDLNSLAGQPWVIDVNELTTIALMLVCIEQVSGSSAFIASHWPSMWKKCPCIRALYPHPHLLNGCGHICWWPRTCCQHRLRRQSSDEQGYC